MMMPIFTTSPRMADKLPTKKSAFTGAAACMENADIDINDPEFWMKVAPEVMNESLKTTSFRGVWRRTELFEPRGQLGPAEDREKIVIWMQSRSGLFVDIRVCPDANDNTNPHNLKSFAGTGEYDSALHHFTWTRLMDFRPPGAPDVGLVRFTSPGVVEEDGVLPGDDFKEVWTQQLEPGNAGTNCDFVSEVRNASGERKGYFLVVGDYFAFTLSRESGLSNEKMNNYFDCEGDLTAGDMDILMSHVCVMGRTHDWKVVYSLDSSTVGSSILPGGGAASSASELLRELQWTFVEGSCPEALAVLINPGLKPLPRRFKGLPVPFFFQDKTAERFIAMPTREDDVFLSSLPKGGTTWTNHIVSIMTTGKYDDEGRVRDDYEPYLGDIGHQVYPEALDLERLSEEEKDTASDEDKLRRIYFGDFTLEDLENQASPRLFSTHLFGSSWLPKQLVESGGRGRLIIVLRNLKDTLTSLHYFRGEAKDGWLGNEHGKGSLARFIEDDCPNAYGSSFEWIAQNNELYNQLVASGRVLVLYFEDLKEDLPGQLAVLHDFLGLGPLSAKKSEAIRGEVDFQSMKRQANEMMSMLLRKGKVGDWKNHLSAELWARLDAVFEDRLTGVEIAAPLRRYHL